MSDDIVITVEPWEMNENVGLMFQHDIYDDDLYESVDRYAARSRSRNNDATRRRNAFERSLNESCVDCDFSSSSSSSRSSVTSDHRTARSKESSSESSSYSSADPESYSSIDSSFDSSSLSGSSTSSSKSRSTESCSSFTDLRACFPLSSDMISPFSSTTRSNARDEFSKSPAAKRDWPKRGATSKSFLDELFDAGAEGGKNSFRQRVSTSNDDAVDEERDDYFEYVDETHLHDILDGLYNRRDDAKKSGIFHHRNATRVAFGTTFDDVRYANFDDGPFVKIIDSTNRERGANEERQKSTSALGILGSDEKVWTIESIRTSVALADSTELNNLSKSTLKKLLLRLHPDKNRSTNDHECRSLFDKVYQVYSTKQ